MKLFNDEGIVATRFYGGDELHMDCELYLCIPV
jgi:hypothetical protein